MIAKMLSDLKEEDLRGLLTRDVGINDVLETVNKIVMEVGEKGDEALFSLTERFEGAKLDDLRVSQEEIDAAYDLVEERLKEALADAADNIFLFHRQQKDRDLWLTEVAPGVTVGQKTVPWRA
jgi:histidinol dehydrogenase